MGLAVGKFDLEIGEFQFQFVIGGKPFAAVRNAGDAAIAFQGTHGQRPDEAQWRIAPLRLRIDLEFAGFGHHQDARGFQQLAAEQAIHGQLP